METLKIKFEIKAVTNIAERKEKEGTFFASKVNVAWHKKINYQPIRSMAIFRSIKPNFFLLFFAFGKYTKSNVSM